MTERYRHGTWELSCWGHLACAIPRVRSTYRRQILAIWRTCLEGLCPQPAGGLLWPTTWSHGRNNLVHQLRRLYAAQGASWWCQATFVAGPEVHVDGSGSDGAAGTRGVAWAELPELHDWLLARRERLNGERAAAGAHRPAPGRRGPLGRCANGGGPTARAEPTV